MITIQSNSHGKIAGSRATSLVRTRYGIFRKLQEHSCVQWISYHMLSLQNFPFAARIKLIPTFKYHKICCSSSILRRRAQPAFPAIPKIWSNVAKTTPYTRLPYCLVVHILPGRWFTVGIQSRQLCILWCQNHSTAPHTTQAKMNQKLRPKISTEATSRTDSTNNVPT